MTTKMKRKVDWTKYTPFQQKVLKAICKIPVGQAWTYGQVARKIGQPKAARAVGHALSVNRDAPDVPCHRVVGAGGRMVGYSAPGGVQTKIKMLKAEGYLK